MSSDILCLLKDSLFVFVAEFNACVGDHLFDFLLAVHAADEKNAVGIGHDVVFETVGHNEFFAADGKDIARAVVSEYVAVLSDVVIVVLWREVEERAPCAEVAPAEGNGFDVYV